MKRVRSRNGIKLETVNNMPAFRRRFANAMAKAGTAGAEAVKAELEEIWRSSRGWAPNAPPTAQRKGGSKPMLDEGFLLNSLEIIPKSIGMREYSAKIGWFDERHPNFPGSVAALAALHDGLTPPHDGHFPSRPWISQVAYSPAAHARIFNRMEKVFLASLGMGTGRSAFSTAAFEKVMGGTL